MSMHLRAVAVSTLVTCVASIAPVAAEAAVPEEAGYLDSTSRLWPMWEQPCTVMPQPEVDSEQASLVPRETITVTAAIDVTARSNDDAADTVDVEADTELTGFLSSVTDPRRIRLRTSTSASAQAPLGFMTDCPLRAEAVTQVHSPFEVSGRGWLLSRASLSGAHSSLYVGVTERESGGTVTQHLLEGDRDEMTGRLLLEPGSYVLDSEAASHAYAHQATAEQQASGTATLDARFVRVGRALGATLGSARRAVRLGSGVDCLERTGVVTAKRGLRSLVVRVDGIRALRADDVRRGQRLTYAVPGGASGDLTVRVRVDPRASEAGTAMRTYVACA